jgi:hypothetical protein
VLELWPEGALPDALPPDQQSALKEAEAAVVESDDTYTSRLDAIESDLGVGKYGKAST